MNKKYFIRNESTKKEIPCRNFEEARAEAKIFSSKNNEKYIVVIK